MWSAAPSAGQVRQMTHAPPADLGNKSRHYPLAVKIDAAHGARGTIEKSNLESISHRPASVESDFGFADGRIVLNE